MRVEEFFRLLGFIAGIAVGSLIMMVWHTQSDCPFYKRGYEAAVEDFYKGQLKCDRVEEPVVKYVWRKE